MRNKTFNYQGFMLNLIFTLESLNHYFLFYFRFDAEAFHKDCDNKGIIIVFLLIKKFNFLRFYLSDYVQQFRAK